MSLTKPQRRVLRYVQRWGSVWLLKHRETLQTVRSLQRKGLVQMVEAEKIVKVWVQ